MRRVPNNASGKWLAMSDADAARIAARDSDRQARRDANAADAYQIAQTSKAAFRAWVAMKVDPGLKTDAQRDAANVAFVSKWGAK